MISFLLFVILCCYNSALICDILIRLCGFTNSFLTQNFFSLATIAGYIFLFWGALKFYPLFYAVLEIAFMTPYFWMMLKALPILKRHHIKKYATGSLDAMSPMMRRSSTRCKALHKYVICVCACWSVCIISSWALFPCNLLGFFMFSSCLMLIVILVRTWGKQKLFCFHCELRGERVLGKYDLQSALVCACAICC